MASVSKVSSNGKHKFTLTVTTNSRDAEANTSNITATFKIAPAKTTVDAPGWNYASTVPVSYTITIDGKKYTGSIMKYTKNETATVRTVTLNVKHNVDGSKSLTYGFSVTSLSGNVLPGTASATVKEALTRINRASSFTANGTWYVGHSMKKYMTVSSYDSGFYHRVKYSIGSTSGYMAGTNEKDSYIQGDGAYYLSIPAEIGNEIPNALSGTVKVTLETFALETDGTYTSIGTTSKNVTVYIDKELCKPELDPTVEDVNVETTYLTGNKNILVKYCSIVDIKPNALAIGGATLKKVTLNGAEEVVSKETGESVFPIKQPIEFNTFTFDVTDSRGLWSGVTLTKPMLEYVKPTINLELTRPNGEGVMKVKVHGNYWNENFGAHDNVIILNFRCKPPSNEVDEDGNPIENWTEWVNIPLENIQFSEWEEKKHYNIELGEVVEYVNDFTYEAEAEYTVPDYTQKWIFEARIADMLRTVDSEQHSVKAYPIFDWSENDFNFNVPVKFSYEGGMTSTALVGMANALSSVYNFTVTSTNNTGWSVTAKNSALIGGSLRFSFNATRDTALAAGNNANEDIGSFTIKHGGKLAQAGNTSFVSGATGPVCSFVTTNLSLDDEKLTFTVQLAANSASAKQVGGFVILPVALNLEAFATTLGEEDIPDEASLMTLALDDFGYEPCEDITIV